MSDNKTGNIGEYDATTGALVNSGFVKGVGNGQGLAVQWNWLYACGSSLDGSIFDTNSGDTIGYWYGSYVSGNLEFVDEPNTIYAYDIAGNNYYIH